MKSILFSFLCLFLFEAGINAQILESRNYSQFTYIYKIDNELAKSIFKDKIGYYWNEKLDYLTNLVDSFYTDSIKNENALAPGHYLFVKTVGLNLNVEYVKTLNIELKILKNHKDFCFILLDEYKEQIKNAKVSIGLKNAKYDPDIEAYRIKKYYQKNGILTANVNEQEVFFNLEQYYYGSSFLRTYRRIVYSKPLRYLSVPIRYLLSPIRKLINKVKYAARGFGRDYSYNGHRGKIFRGYIALNKPKYHLGDTVKIKAFVVKRHGKPYNKPAHLSIRTIRRYGTKVLSKTIYPLSAGVYTYEFVVTDSFKLGYSYDVEIRSKENRRSYLGNSFRYEDYELDEVKYEIKSSKKKYFYKEPIAFFAKATDANGMSSLDARVNITISNNSISDFYEQELFVPNNIWAYNGFLDPVGETKINIPDSVLPDAKLDLSVKVKFSNSNNELHEETLYISYDGRKEYIEAKIINDSLFVKFLQEGVSVEGKAKLSALVQNDTVSYTDIALPNSIIINPTIEKYLITKGNNLSDVISLSENKPLVTSMNYRNNDTILFNLINPANLDIRYNIFKDRDLLEEGITKELYRLILDKSQSSYEINYEYSWGGQLYYLNFPLRIFNKDLEVKIENKPTIIPGQEVDFKVKVNDIDKEPVANVNLTAYAYNGKFDTDNVPDIPYLGKGVKTPQYFPPPNASSNEYADNLWKGSLNLKWIKMMGLDTSDYYKFHFPDNDIFMYYDSIKTENAQFAPYTSTIANFILYIFIDDKMIFDYTCSNNRPYSFIINEGIHTVRLQTRSKEISIDSVMFIKGLKLILSVNPNMKNINVSINKTNRKDLKKLKTETAESTLLIKTQLLNSPIYISQGNKIYQIGDNVNMLQDSWQYRQSSAYHIGPLDSGLVRIEGVNMDTLFLFQSGYEYKIIDCEIFSKKLDYQLSRNNGMVSINSFSNEVALSRPFFKRETSTISRKKQVEYSYNYHYTSQGNGTLFLKYTGKPILQIVLTKYGEVHNDVYKGHNRKIYNILPGQYALTFVFDKDSFTTIDSIKIKPNGTSCKSFTYSDLNISPPFTLPDFFTTEEFIMESNSDNGVYSLAGNVRDAETGEGIPFVNIVAEVNGIVRFGTTTDFDGNYRMSLPPNTYTLHFNFVGYQTKVIANVVIQYDKIRYYDPILSPSTTVLQEVECVYEKDPLFAYDRTTTGGTITKDNIQCMPTRNLSTLASRVDGVMVNLRGSRSSETVYYVDGIPVRGNTNLPPNAIEQVTTTNGKVGPDMNLKNYLSNDGSKLRNRFSDEGFWVPNVWTNEAGEADFKVRFPDDLTNWNTVILAMNGKKQSGMAQTTVQSFKPLVASLNLPRFLLQGDTTYAIGKVLNYTNDSIAITTNYTLNDKVVFTHNLNVQNAQIEHLQINAESADSLIVQYDFKTIEGYADGERKEIPIFPIGLEKAQGNFSLLLKDTAFSVNKSSSTENMTLHFENSLADNLINDLDYLEDYPYYCMEQTASKLRGLLLKEKIYANSTQNINLSKKINTLIKQLEKGQNDDGSWGWWANGFGNDWMTCYVTNALIEAKASGYNLKKLNAAVNYLKWHIDLFSNYNQLLACDILSRYDAELVDKSVVDRLDSELNDSSLYQFLMITKIKQHLNMKIDIDSIITLKKNTYFGGVYWGEESLAWYDNSISLTLLAYDIIKISKQHNDLLEGIRNFFLEQKASGRWRNTIETAEILAGILPDIDSNINLKDQQTTIYINNKKIEEFPYTINLTDTSFYNIKKEGAFPVYYTNYTKSWDSNPKENQTDFKVKTHLESDGKVLDKLVAGQPTELIIQIELKSNSKYVHIEVPIPAGCSYGKGNKENYNENHREIAKHKTSIFCENLGKGKHQFIIKLQPRYTGSYTLNPAKVELMYFPTFYGNNAVKKVDILGME